MTATRRRLPRSNGGSGWGLGRLVPGSSGLRGEATATRRCRPRAGGFDRGWRGWHGYERVGENGGKHGAVPAQRLCPPCAASPLSAKSAKSAVPSLLVTRRASFLGSARRTSAFRLRGGERGPAEHADGRRTGQGRAGPWPAQSTFAPREARSTSFLSSPWSRRASRCIGTDGWRRLWDATTPNPLRQRRGLEFFGTGDRGWRPGGLTPGYCLKPFQGFGDGLGKDTGSPDLMTGVARAREVWRRDVSNPEVIDAAGRGWDVSSQKVLGARARKVWRRDVSNPEVIEGLDGGWDVSSQGVLVSKARKVWRRDVSTPEVIERPGRGWDVSSQKVLGCEGAGRRRDIAAPRGWI